MEIKPKSQNSRMEKMVRGPAVENKCARVIATGITVSFGRLRIFTDLYQKYNKNPSFEISETSKCI